MKARLAFIVSLGALAASLLGACSLDIGEIPFKCNKGGYPLCPAGYECKFSEWCVQEGTCPSTLAGCGGDGGSCGNGKCEAGESASCPADCANTEAGVTGDVGMQWPDQGVNTPDIDPWAPDQPPLPPDMPPLPPDMPVTGGDFGDKCSLSSPNCNSGLTCIGIGTGATMGFCTKTCPTSGSPCTGTPTGTFAACLLKDSSNKYYCAFLCKLSTQSWSCPGTLSCSPSANPPGSDQHPCMP